MKVAQNSRLITNEKLKKYLWSNSRLYPPIKIGIVEKCLYSLINYVALQTVLLMKVSWTEWDFGKKVSSVENLNLTLLILLHLTELYFMQDLISISLRLIDSDYCIDETQVSGKLVKIIAEEEEKVMKIVKISRYIFKCFFFGYTYISVFSIIAYASNYKSLEELALPFQVYIPIPIAPSIYLYISVAFFQWLYLLFCFNISFMIFSNTIIVLEHVRIEMKIFQARLTEFKEFKIKILSQCWENHEINLNEVRETVDSSRLLAVHHQTVFRKVHQLIRGLRFRIFYVNFFICAQVCFAIFCVEAGDTIYKIKYGFITVSLLIAGGIFSENGQRVQDEAEEIRRSLFDLYSIEQPRWFQRHLLIMMIQNNHIPTIGFLNTFTLNRNNIAAVVQAAYSYFNLLNQSY